MPALFRVAQSTSQANWMLEELERAGVAFEDISLVLAAPGPGDNSTAKFCYELPTRFREVVCQAGFVAAGPAAVNLQFAQTARMEIALEQSLRAMGMEDVEIESFRPAVAHGAVLVSVLYDTHGEGVRASIAMWTCGARRLGEPALPIAA